MLDIGSTQLYFFVASDPANPPLPFWGFKLTDHMFLAGYSHRKMIPFSLLAYYHTLSSTYPATARHGSRYQRQPSPVDIRLDLRLGAS